MTPERDLGDELVTFMRGQTELGPQEYSVELGYVVRRLERSFAARPDSRAGVLIRRLRAQAEDAAEGEADRPEVGLILDELITLLDIEFPEIIVRPFDAGAGSEEVARSPEPVPVAPVDATEIRGRIPHHGPTSRAPASPAERANLIRQQWPSILQQIADVRALVGHQRDILLEQMARAAMKPDFARSRKWARDIPGVLPREQGWDEDWFVGDAPPLPATHSAISVGSEEPPPHAEDASPATFRELSQE